jgi:hypothetical protein
LIDFLAHNGLGREVPFTSWLSLCLLFKIEGCSKHTREKIDGSRKQRSGRDPVKIRLSERHFVTSLLALGAFLAPILEPPITQTELLGKTTDEVVRMGRVKWSEFFGEKVGWSTADMVEAELLYGRARQVFNNRMTREMSKGQREALEEMRREMVALHGFACDLGYIMSGGGTMWNPIRAGALGDAEETVTNFLRGRPAGKQPSFLTEWERLRKDLAAKKREVDNMKDAVGGGYTDATKALNQLRNTVLRLEAVAPRLPGSRGHINAFAVDAIRLARSMG